MGRWEAKPPIITVLGSVCGFRYNNIYFMKLGAPVFGACMFQIVISS